MHSNSGRGRQQQARPAPPAGRGLPAQRQPAQRQPYNPAVQAPIGGISVTIDNDLYSLVRFQGFMAGSRV